MADAHPSREQDDRHDQRVEHGRRQIRLNRSQHVEGPDDHDERQHAFGEPAQCVAFTHDQHGGPRHYRDLGELRWLNGCPEQEPPRSMDAGRDRLRKRQNHDQHEGQREPHERPRPPGPSLGIELRGDREQE